MSQVRFLMDESLRLSTVAAMHRIEPALDVHRLGQVEMPSFGTPDQDILTFCEEVERLLVQLDRASFPAHVANHLAAGGHTAGVLLVTPGCSFRRLLDDLLLIWSCTTADEWRDAILYLPFS